MRYFANAMAKAKQPAGPPMTLGKMRVHYAFEILSGQNAHTAAGQRRSVQVLHG
jgi:hypothetical protein